MTDYINQEVSNEQENHGNHRRGGNPAVIAVGTRLANRGKDINGVYTLNNSVILNVREPNPIAKGAGWLTVGEGERIRLEYSFTEGSFDVVFSTDTDAVRNVEMTQENYDPNKAGFLPDDWQSFEAELMKVDGTIAQGGIQGKGELDFDAQPGTYEVIFYIHDAEGTATVTAKK